VNLDAANLAGADFGRLTGFRNRRLQGADLRVANFHHADLGGTRLSGAEMNDSAAYGPDFTDETPRRSSWSYEKYWYSVQFDCADLTDTQLDGAGLTGALFGRANMNRTNLDRANISRADFTRVRNLDTVNFGDACADDTPQFPEGFVCQIRKCSEIERGTGKICVFSSSALKQKTDDLANTCAKD
jgi:uncharacterized protein YjbI with pentapeptide repeats